MNLQLSTPRILRSEGAQDGLGFAAHPAAPWRKRARQARPQELVRTSGKPLDLAVEQPAPVQPASPTPPQSLTEKVLSSGTIEGDPHKALKVCEAYWTVRLIPSSHVPTNRLL